MMDPAQTESASGMPSATASATLKPQMAVIAIKNYIPPDNVPNTLHLEVDDVVYVLNTTNMHWWDGITSDPIGNINRGWFPAACVRPYKQYKSRSMSDINSTQSIDNLSDTNNSESYNNDNVNHMNNFNPAFRTNKLKSTDHHFERIEGDRSMSSDKTITDNITGHSSNPSSPLLSTINHQQRRQSLRTRQPSHSSNYGSFKFQKSSFSQSPNNGDSHGSSPNIRDHTTSNPTGLSTIPASSSTTQFIPTANASPNMFKEKNYFVSRNDSTVSQNSQILPHDSRQSSRAFTERSMSSAPNSICLVSKDEIMSYFSTSNPQTQPGLNFIPIWYPKFNENFEVVYKNKALNVYTDETPLINANHINEKTLFETPETLNVFDDLAQIDFDSNLTNLDMSNSTTNKNSSLNLPKSVHMDPSGSSGLGGAYLLNGLPEISNLRLTEVFYTESTDHLTWDSLVSSFINSLDDCIANLKAHDKLNFNAALNNASTSLTYYHTAGRLIRQQLIESDYMVKFSLVIKKITNMFIQFRIWSNLAILSIDAYDSYNSDQFMRLENVEITEETIGKYIDDIIYYRNKLEKLSLHIVRMVASMNLKSSTETLNKNSGKLLPMIYTRFIRDKFEGGNFKNKFINGQSNQSNNDFNSRQGNTLLDDDVIEKLKFYEKEIFTLLKEAKETLSEKLPPDTPLKKFIEARNLRLLTIIYKCIPAMCLFVDLVESIDLTVFAMIDKLAGNLAAAGRNSTLVSSNETSSSKPNRFSHFSKFSNEDILHTGDIYRESEVNPNEIRNGNDNVIAENVDRAQNENETENETENDNDNDNDNDNEEENDSQSFYDATAKIFRPMIHDYIQLKQSVHSSFTDLILDSQSITAVDPETFFSIKKDKVKSSRDSKLKVMAGMMLERLEQIDSELYNDGLYTLESSLKLFETIKLTKDRIKLIIMSINQLKEERISILNYCSRLMNSDFNIASLFIAERHNTLVSKMSQTSHSGNSNSTSSNDPSNNVEYNYGEMKSSIDENMASSVDMMDKDHSGTNANIPWYLNIDRDQQNLVYESSSLKGGTIRALVAKLVNPLNQHDQIYEQTFLCFFSTFMKPVKLFEILIENYYLTMPEALSYEEYGIWLEQKLKPQQKRIIEIFITLFSRYWLVDYTSAELVSLWDGFVSEVQFEDTSIVDLANKIFTFIHQEDYFEYFKLINMEPKHIPMSPLTPAIKHMKIESLNLNYVAKQITAIQAFYFRKLNLWDLMGRSYNYAKVLKRQNERGNLIHSRDPLGTKNISIFIKNCNRLTHYTTYIILKYTDLDERIEIIKFFISLAEKLLLLKNYSSMTAVISGLGSTSVSRLRKTWEKIPESYVFKFHKMDNLMSIGKNYSEYRNILKFVESDDDAYLPFLGMYLSDLRFTTDGNPDWLSSKKGSKGLVNFSKRINIMKIINEVLDFNNTLYNIELDKNFSRYMHEMFNQLPDDEKLYEMSIQIEPRVSLLKSKPGINIGTIGSAGSISNAREHVHFDNPTLSGKTFAEGGHRSGGEHHTATTLKGNLALHGISTQLRSIESKVDNQIHRRPKSYRPLVSLIDSTTNDIAKDSNQDRTQN